MARVFTADEVLAMSGDEIRNLNDEDFAAALQAAQAVPVGQTPEAEVTREVLPEGTALTRFDPPTDPAS